MSPLEYTRQTQAHTLIKVISAEIIFSYFLCKAQLSVRALSSQNKNKYVFPFPSQCSVNTYTQTYNRTQLCTSSRNYDRFSLWSLLRHISAHKVFYVPNQKRWTSTLNPSGSLWTSVSGRAKAPFAKLENLRQNTNNYTSTKQLKQKHPHWSFFFHFKTCWSNKVGVLQRVKTDVCEAGTSWRKPEIQSPQRTADSVGWKK